MNATTATPVAAVPAITFKIPGLPPSANLAYQHVRYSSKGGASYTGRRLTPNAEAWRGAAAMIVRSAAAHAGVACTRRQRLGVTLVFSTPSLYRVDLDNLLKLSVDAIALGLAVDDRYITMITAWKQYGDEPETAGQVDVLNSYTEHKYGAGKEDPRS